MNRRKLVALLVMLIFNICILSAHLQKAISKHHKSLNIFKGSLLRGETLQLSPRGCDGKNGGGSGTINIDADDKKK